MFEGLVSQVLAGYLGRYVKGIQKEQLRVGLWNEEILLENVELILEAFDYLQLPFTFKKGQIGRLSIKIPWKRLGWEPVIVVLEDVFLCACQRGDDEWSANLVEKRELAGKMAKLNAIELEKFSKRVSDNHAGQSFISYLTTKILDSIQLSIKNVHFIYVDSHNHQGEYIFGLKFSSLTIMTDTTKHTSSVSSVGKSKGGPVNKILEISCVAIYCNMLKESQKSVFTIITEPKSFSELNFNIESFNFLLLPFDVRISLLANKSRKFSSTFAFDIELTTLEVTLSEMQLHQIISLFDYFSICVLRERYGRYRPSQISLSRKLSGWQRMWWKYAQNAVLTDARRKLWKTSWSSFGKRIIERRKYVNLYKTKLELLQQEQIVSKDIILELEEMDRRCYIDDILNYRHSAEQKLQEVSMSKYSTMGTNDAFEKQLPDGKPSNAARGWLNWLSLGMLGAGGTAESSSFTGVVSDEIIKDFCEATEFNPVGFFSNEDSIRRENFVIFSVRLNIYQISAAIFSKPEVKIMEAFLTGISVEGQFSEISSKIVALIDSVTLIDPINGKALLIANKSTVDDSTLPFVSVHINIPKSCGELFIKIELQPFEATYESDFFLKLSGICDVLLSFQSWHKRVLLSLNGLKDMKNRLYFKAEYILHNFWKVKWDVSFHNFIIKFPFINESSEPSILLLESEGLYFKSSSKIVGAQTLFDEPTSCVKQIMDNGISNCCLQEFYDQFEIVLSAFGMKLFIPTFPIAISVIEKCNMSYDVRMCIFMDEPLMKAFEVNCLITTLCARFSTTVLGSMLKFYEFLQKKSVSPLRRVQPSFKFDQPNTSGASYFSFSLRLTDITISVELEDSESSDSLILLTFSRLVAMFIGGNSIELSGNMEAIVFSTSDAKFKQDRLILCSARSFSANSPLLASVESNAFGECCADEIKFQLIYKSSIDCKHKYSISLSKADLHVYPRICGLLEIFFSRIIETVVSSSEVNQKDYNFDGFSNFYASHASMLGGIYMDNFPFVAIHNSYSPSNLGNSNIPSIKRFQDMGVIDNQSSKIHEYSMNERSSSINQFNMDFIWLDIKVDDVNVHFHDLSYQLGTIRAPQVRSTILLLGARCWDVLVSTNMLSFYSALSSHEAAWGFSSPNLLSTLNFRARKLKCEANVEISFGLQHVSCILTSELLSMLIGYFSLPDWNPFIGSIKKNDMRSNFCEDDRNSKDYAVIIYKFEILDSILILPVEIHTDFVLQVNVPRVYCDFVPANSPENAFKGIPSECVASSGVIANKLDAMDLHGRNLSLSIVPLKGDAKFIFNRPEYFSNETIPFIERLDADFWLRIPCKVLDFVESFDFPLSIMMKVDTCKLLIKEKYFIDGVGATAYVADQFSLVGKESEYFRSDVLQFKNLKKKMKDATPTIPDMTDGSFVIMKICVKALSIKFSRVLEKQSSSLETIAKAYLRLDFSVTFQNGLPKSIDLDISSLLLRSFLSDALLISFASDGDLTFHLFINLSKSVGREAEIVLTLPDIDIWVNISEWDCIFDFICSCKKNLSVKASSSSTTLESPSQNALNHETYLHSASDIVIDEIVIMTMKSGNMNISFHLPIWDAQGSLERPKCTSEQISPAFDASFVKDVTLCQSKPHRHVILILQSKYCELTLRKNLVELKCNVEQIRTLLEKAQDQEMQSLPFLYLSHMKLESVIHVKERLTQAFIEIQISSVDVGLSYELFKFWSHIWAISHDTTVSRLPSHCIMLKVRLMKCALLLRDGRGSFHGPILEVLMNNLTIQLSQKKDSLKCSGSSDLLVNYNNIDKVVWEPFVEPWSFQFKFIRKEEGNILLGQAATSDICIESNSQLNLNLTEPLVEALVRLQKMISEASQSAEVHEKSINFGYMPNDKVHIRRYAPYILHNDTSLPLTFNVSQDLVSAQEVQSSGRDFPVVQPGFSIPIYVEEALEEQFIRHRQANSSEQLIEKKLNAASHHLISIHFAGTSGPSKPLSMDLVGLSCFEIKFSNNGSKFNWTTEERLPDDDHRKGLAVPVIFEVSMPHYRKMIRLYSTVILMNTTSMPLELRLDIPFGVSPKILDPILPGQELPLPLHLAETGLLRCHPAGPNYLWSETQSLPNILSQGNRLGYFRSFVCYPAHPSNHPFRCCISVQDYNFSSQCTGKSSFTPGDKRMNNASLPKNSIIHNVKLITPLLLRNYLPVRLSVMVESGGVAHSLQLSEGNVTSFYAIDSMHDLEVTYKMEGYMPVISKFPRAESFCEIAKSSGFKCLLPEKILFTPLSCAGPLSITLEKTLDQSCGAREISLSVMYLLYNCTGLLLAINNGHEDHKKTSHLIPSCYPSVEQAQLEDEKQGLALLFPHWKPFHGDNTMLKSQASSGRIKGVDPSFSSKKVGGASRCTIQGFSESAKPYMYSPMGHIPASDLLVRLAVSSSQIKAENVHSAAWSTPFPLVPASGSISVTIPKPNASGAFLISVTSVTVPEKLSGRTRALTFQPRFVICNACSKDLSYRQKGTNNICSLPVEQHSHLHWSDTSRELLVSLRFNEMGWEWSGSFLPNCFGDVVVKMRNYATGELNMVRVEVQNADMALNDEKSNHKSNGSSSTQLILLSDDNTGFIPYRIDNFSMERFRIYQQKSESVETVVHPYTSCKYAWDEPCHSHRLIVEVPGERIVGTYNLDNVQDCAPVYFPSTFKKPERRFSVSVHAEGATKVLSIIDSSYHIIRDIEGGDFCGFKEKRKADHGHSQDGYFNEVIKINLPFCGISLMNSTPQELIFACSRETTVVLMQNAEQQKVLVQISSLQIDNQLSDTPYPIILSFENENRGKSLNYSKDKETWLQIQHDSSSSYATWEPAFYFSATKWRKSDNSLISFENITFRLASLCVELDEQIVLFLFDFFRTVHSRVRRTSLRAPEAKEAVSFMLPIVVPMGAPWQQIYLLARRQKKIYIESFELASVILSFSFSSSSLKIRSEVFNEVESIACFNSTAFQRGIMALVDVEGVPVHLRQLTFEHLMASPNSIQDILVRHYMRQLLHEIYKLFGSAGVIGNPIGFARNVKLGIKDFLSVSRRGVLKSPNGLLNGIIDGSKSLFSSTVYALSSAATQFSKSAHKGIVAFTFDEQTVTEMDKHLQGTDQHGKGVLNEILEGLTGLLQSPIRGAEKHGLFGVLSGIAMGTTGLVARPIASILEATTKTAQSIRNRSSPHLSSRRRIRLPRPLSGELPLSPYSWEEAIGVSMLHDVPGLKDEVYVICKALKKAGGFMAISKKQVLVFSSSCLANLKSANFPGVPAKPLWVIEKKMSLESVVHVDREDCDLNIVGNSAEVLPFRQKIGVKSWRTTSAPFTCISVEFPNSEEAEDGLQVLQATIEMGKEKKWDAKVMHRINVG